MNLWDSNKVRLEKRRLKYYLDTWLVLWWLKLASEPFWSYMSVSFSKRSKPCRGLSKTCLEDRHGKPFPSSSSCKGRASQMAGHSLRWFSCFISPAESKSSQKTTQGPWSKTNSPSEMLRAKSVMNPFHPTAPSPASGPGGPFVQLLWTWWW